MSQSEFQLLQEQIKGLTTLVNAQFQSTHERLDKINGKVSTHEVQIQEALIERAKNREEQKHVKDYVDKSCNKVDAIEKSLEEYRMALKYPKLLIGALVFVIILSIMTFIESNKKISKAIGLEPPQTEQVK